MSHNDPARRTRVSAERLAKLFVDVADTLVDNFDEGEFLRMLTRRVAGLLDTGQVGLMLADHRDQLVFTAASGENARLMELLQLRHDDGPGLEAFRTARQVTDVNLAGAQGRWPYFAPRASQAGFASVHAFPLRLRAQVIGVMSVFGGATALNDADLTVVQSLADAATIGLSHRRAVHHGHALAEQLQGALNSRVVIEQAKGIVGQFRGVSPDEAFALIRGHARGNNQRLSDVATSLVTGRLALPDLK